MARARALFDQACKYGDAAGCYIAGIMFRKGDGGARDEVRAQALLDQACKGGVARGC
jgi:TPR repeat protein